MSTLKTKRSNSKPNNVAQQRTADVRTGKPARTTKGGFVVLSKGEVAANRCKAYTYVM